MIKNDEDSTRAGVHAHSRRLLPPRDPQVATAEFIAAQAGSGIPPRFRAPRG